MWFFGCSHNRPRVWITSDNDTDVTDDTDTVERNTTMTARPNWKVLTVSAALAGLGITGAGIAMADSDGAGSSRVEPIEVSAAQAPADPSGDNADRGNGNAGGKQDNAHADDSPDNTPDDADDSPDNTPDDTPDDADDTPDND